MKKASLLLLLLAATGCFAQSRIKIEGRITNEDNIAVEYATIGIPSRSTGILSNSNGTYTLDTEANNSDTVFVSHLAYEDIRIPLSELINRSGNIVMKAKTLDEVVVYSGERKKAKLAGKGMKIPGSATALSIGNKGCEIGSIVEVKNIFELQEISFKVRANNIPGAKFSVNIYRENEQTGKFLNTLCKPIYFDIPTNDNKQDISIEVKDAVAIEPGRYFVSIMFIDHDKSIEASAKNSSIHFPLYLKSSYRRNSVMSELESIPINMGLTLKGVEYR